MPDDLKDNPSSKSSIVTLNTGEMPVALYWGTPAVTFVACVALLILFRLAIPTEHRKPRMIAAAMISAALLLAAIAQSVRQVRWERLGFRRRLVALEAMGRVNALLGTDAGGEVAVLDQLAPAIAAMLGMKMSCAGILEEEGRVLHIVASDKVARPLTGRRIALGELPMTQLCMQMGRVTVMSDTHHPTGPINAELARSLGMRSMIFIPMLFQGQSLGLLALGDDRPRHFTDGDMRRAWLWGCQATLALVNSRLFQKMSGSLQEQQRMMEHRNALYEINTVIQRPGRLDEILNRIAEMAPAPLQVDTAVIWMIADDDPEKIYIGAATKPYGERVTGMKMPIRGSKAEAIFATRESLVIEDCSNDPTLNPRFNGKLPGGSLLFEPLLRGDGQPLGVLTLCRHKPGPFSAQQMEIARLFSSRVAAAIEMASLYQQTRRDADAKATLLGELNHRVKNNLAGIVTLLTLSPPPMGPAARHWLDRAIARIRAMAQAHELFTNRIDAVTLDELVQRTLMSLSVAKPPGVEVKLELSAGSARLRTQRAISLAMAMHELCFNGLIHGLRDGGTLTIRANRNNGELNLEIEDDAGTGKPAPSPIERPAHDGRSGDGLNIVRGLVTRELGGRFNLVCAPGGALATIHIPLMADEMRESPL